MKKFYPVNTFKFNKLFMLKLVFQVYIDRQTDRQRDRQTDRQRDRETDRQIDRQIDRCTETIFCGNR